MAPNHKQIHLITSSLAELDVVQSKFLPLTHPETEQQTSVTPSASASVSDSDFYWNWVSPDVVEEEAQLDLFSCNAIERNLIKDAQQDRSAAMIKADETDEQYWSWTEPQVVEEEAEATVTVRASAITSASASEEYFVWEHRRSNVKLLFNHVSEYDDSQYWVF